MGGRGGGGRDGNWSNGKGVGFVKVVQEKIKLWLCALFSLKIRVLYMCIELFLFLLTSKYFLKLQFSFQSMIFSYYNCPLLLQHFSVL